MVDLAVEDWWKQSSKVGVRVLYTMTDEGGKSMPSLTYSGNYYEDGFPETADNGESVEPDLSFGVPSECMPDTSAIRYKATTYRDLFQTEMAKAFIEAASSRKLDATEAFYAAWNGLSEDEKVIKARAYASDILNTEVYHIACEVMHDNHLFVIEVAETYTNYCKHAMDLNSGVNAMLNAMYLTHGFEGEIRDEIESFCDAMVVRTGVYGQFALSCACQDDMMRPSERETLQQLFTTAVIKMAEKKEYAITGYDNFCYVTGTRVVLDKVTISSKYGYKRAESSYKGGFRKSDWIVTAPNMMNDMYSQVLYNQYKTLDQGCGSFAAYLNKYGTGVPEDYQSQIMTKFGSTVDFSLNEGIPMVSRRILGNYFSDSGTYMINTGNSKKIENKYFQIHDKLIYDYMDMKDEELRVDQTAAARALYGESHRYWLTDEIHLFSTPNIKQLHGPAEGDYYDVHLSFDVDILKLQPSKDVNGDGTYPEDPFFAFDSPVLTEGVSDVIGPVIMDSKKPLTDVLLKKSSYGYTGKAIRPSVTVKAGAKTVPKGSYEVRYTDNKSAGRATVIVEGKGRYSGMVCSHFTIAPKGTSIRKVTRKSRTATVRWKKQASRMTSSRITGYQIRYSSKSSMNGAKTISVRGYSKTAKKIGGLKKNKKYYFRIRTYLTTDEEIIYSGWSKKRSLRTKP